MKTEKPKPKKTSENKAWARPEKNQPDPPAVPPEELAACPWGRLVMFVNESYSEWVPQTDKNKEIHRSIAPIHKKCVKVVNSDESWEEILNQKFDAVEYEAAENFCFHLSSKYSESPQEVRQQMQANLSQFVELAEYALLADSENLDLTKKSELCEVIDYIKKSQERTYLFLSELPSVLEEDAREMLNRSAGYQTLLNWGASRFLKKFGWQLQKRLGIAPKVIKQERKEVDKEIVKKKVGELEERKANQQEELLKEELASSPWGRLVNFLNDAHREFVPRSQKDKERQSHVAPIQKKCVIVLNSGETWEEILNEQIESSEYDTAEKFFFHLSRKYSESPQTVRQQLQKNLSQFVELAEYAFADSENRNLTKLSEFCEVIDYFKKSQERTYLFLAELPSVGDENVSALLKSSVGYQTLLKWGASRFLNEFGWQLQKEFNITPTAIKEEAAQNLVRELGETEANLTNQVELLQQENEKLRNELSEMRSQALQSAVCQFAKTLQTQPQPVLDQIIFLYQRLNKMSESNSELSLSPSDSLSILIALENLLKALNSLNVTPYPAEYDRVFELQSEQLSVYEYIEGSAFANSEDQKVVRCVHPGWRVGEEVITPARVKEVTE